MSLEQFFFQIFTASPTVTLKKSESEEDISLTNICSSGHTFLWDLLVQHSSLVETHLLRKFHDDPTAAALTTTTAACASDDVSLTVACSRSALSQQEKVLKEAEKHLQTLLCLPSTDRRIRLKFIESCLLNLRLNRACVFSLRLLTKLFSSFQQYSSANSSAHMNSSSSSSTITSPKGKYLLGNINYDVIEKISLSFTLPENCLRTEWIH